MANIPIFEEQAPGWSAKGAEPSAEFKAGGYRAGYKPPAGFFNWFWTRVSKALAELQSKVAGYAAANEADKAAAAAAQSAHVSNKSNPHGVTAAQVGALATAGTAVDSAKLGGQAAGYYAKGADLSTHTSNKSNPHGVTAAQVGALAATGTAANSSKLGGQAASYYLAATAKAADSAKLNGQAANYYLAATAKAADSAKLNGQAANYYAAKGPVGNVTLWTGSATAGKTLTVTGIQNYRMLCISTSFAASILIGSTRGNVCRATGVATTATRHSYLAADISVSTNSCTITLVSHQQISNTGAVTMDTSGAVTGIFGVVM